MAAEILDFFLEKGACHLLLQYLSTNSTLFIVYLV